MEDLVKGPHKEDTSAIRFYVGVLYKYLSKNEIPPQAEWKIAYDTMNPIFKLEEIQIVLPKGYYSYDSSWQAILNLSFDYTRHYVSHEYIVSFDVDRLLNGQ